jgi:hypothetical protein
MTTLPPSVSRLPRKMWECQRLTTLWASMAYYNDRFTVFTFTRVKFTFLPSSVLLCAFVVHCGLAGELNMVLPARSVHLIVVSCGFFKR